MSIKAIDTRYGGYLFRSRLEARWAVFFDTIAWLPWAYETEGLDLPSGPYLPDFYLPEIKTWLEVKPAWESGLPEFKLGQEITDADPGAEFIMVFGDPMDAVFNKVPDYELWHPPTIKQHESRFARSMMRSVSTVNYAAGIARRARFEHGAKP